jgi:DNA-binding Lrp family transcriptional regulator
MKKLDDLKRAVLANIELNAELTTAELSRAISLRQSTVTRVTKYLEQGKLIDIAPFINPFVLGYRLTNFFFALSSTNRSNKEKIFRFIRETPGVSWGAELGGRFQFGVCILSRTSDEVLRILEKLQSLSISQMRDKEVVEQLSFTMFPGKFLTKKIVGKSELTRAPSSKSFTADDEDYRILNALINGATSIRETARRLGRPHSSIDWRVNRLRDVGVFKGFIYKRSSLILGTLEFMATITISRRTAELRESLYKFCKMHPHVIFFIEVLGAWDFELRLEVERIEQATETCDQLRQEFDSEILSLELVPILGKIKAAGLPLSAKS